MTGGKVLRPSTSRKANNKPDYEEVEDLSEQEFADANDEVDSDLEDAISVVRDSDDIPDALKSSLSAIMKALSIGTGPNIVKTTKQVAANTQQLGTLQTQVRRLELKMTESSVIIKNLPFKNKTNKSDNLYEKYEDTLTQASSLLNELKLDNTLVRIRDAKRFAPQKNKKGKALTPSTKVTLSNKAEVDLLLSKLPNLRNSKNFKNVQIQRELPQFLIPRKATLDEEAYKIRRAKKGRKTIVTLRGIDLVLLVKEANGTKYEEFEI